MKKNEYSSGPATYHNLHDQARHYFLHFFIQVNDTFELCLKTYLKIGNQMAYSNWSF